MSLALWSPLWSFLFLFLLSALWSFFLLPSPPGPSSSSVPLLPHSVSLASNPPSQLAAHFRKIPAKISLLADDLKSHQEQPRPETKRDTKGEHVHQKWSQQTQHCVERLPSNHKCDKYLKERQNHAMCTSRILFSLESNRLSHAGGKARTGSVC